MDQARRQTYVLPRVFVMTELGILMGKGGGVRGGSLSEMKI